MSTSETNRHVEIALEEYRQLKAEQRQRIGFRDSLVYISIGALGTVASLAGPDNPGLLLAIPLLSIVLGWAYLQNDQKVSAIGAYIRGDLSRFLMEGLGGDQCMKETQARIFGWEFEHRSERGRRTRKVFQLIVDQLAFVVLGIGCLYFYVSSQVELGMATVVIVALELIFLLGLGVQIALCADLRSES